MVRNCLTTAKKLRKLLVITHVLFVPKRQIVVRFHVGAHFKTLLFNMLDFLFIFYSAEQLFQKGKLLHDSGNPKKAVKYYKRAAKKGHTKAQVNLGYCYKNGEGIERSIPNAMKWYQKAADAGEIYAVVNLAKAYRNGIGFPQDKTKAFEMFLVAAKQGIVDAQVEVASCYHHGVGTKQSYKDAFYWYQKAANSGDAEAICNIGVYYEYGNGVDVNIEQAIDCYKKASNLGSTFATTNLASCYQNGKGCIQDLKKAKELYLIAAQKGDARAQNNLGVMFLLGKGTPQNIEQAEYWLRKAAKQNNQNAIDNLHALLQQKEELRTPNNPKEKYEELAKTFGINKIDISNFSLDDKKDMDMAIGIVVNDVKKNFKLKMARVRPFELWEPQIDGILDDNKSFSIIIRVTRAPGINPNDKDSVFTWHLRVREYKEPDLTPTELELNNIHTDYIFYAYVGLMPNGSFDENGNTGFYVKYTGLKKLK